MVAASLPSEPGTVNLVVSIALCGGCSSQVAGLGAVRPRNVTDFVSAGGVHFGTGGGLGRSFTSVGGAGWTWVAGSTAGGTASSPFEAVDHDSAGVAALASLARGAASFNGGNVGVSLPAGAAALGVLCAVPVAFGDSSEQPHTTMAASVKATAAIGTRD